MRILQLICLSLAFLWILLQRINVRFILSGNAQIEVNLTILSIAFTIKENKKAVIKRNLKLIKNLPFFLKAFNFLLKKSDVAINVQNSSEQPSFSAKFPFLITFPIAYAYLNNTARTVYYSGRKSDGGSFFDISLHFALIYMIIFPLVFLYYKLKNKVGRVIKNV